MNITTVCRRACAGRSGRRPRAGPPRGAGGPRGGRRRGGGGGRGGGGCGRLGLDLDGGCCGTAPASSGSGRSGNARALLALPTSTDAGNLVVAQRTEMAAHWNVHL